MDPTAAPVHDLTLDHIRDARERIQPYVKRTPLIPSETLSRRLGANVSLKLELFQKTGSFKVRGAFNKLLSSPQTRDARGIVAVSGGNHAQAVAYAARVLGCRSLILMPRGTPANYVEATHGYGAQVEFAENARQAFDRIQAYEREGWLSVHPFDDPVVIAGQGTAGLEIVEDAPDVTDVVISIGGGGFLSGVATAVKSLKPEVRLWGVETAGADAMSQALQAGQPVQLPAITSIAKTLGAPSVSWRTLGYAQRFLERLTVVSDLETVRALEFLLERVKILAEPAAACTLAAADHLRPEFMQNSRLVLVLCGGNVSLADVCKYRAEL